MIDRLRRLWCDRKPVHVVTDAGSRMMVLDRLTFTEGTYTAHFRELIVVRP